MKEPDVAMGECPFGGHHAVGQAYLEDPWIRDAVRIMAARAPVEEEPATPVRKRTAKTRDVT